MKTLIWIVAGVVTVGAIAYFLSKINGANPQARLTEKQAKKTSEGVDVFLPEKKEEIKKEIKKEHKTTNVLRSFLKNPQVFEFESENGKIITGKEKTILEIPENAFVDSLSNEPIRGKVKFVLNEYYTKKDIILYSYL